MASFNKVILCGNVTRDPELRTVGEKQTPVTTIGLAVNDRFKDKDEVSFFDVTFWGKQAEVICEFVTKGKNLLVEGRLRQETWETDEGQKRSKITVTCENFQFLGGKGKDSEESESEAPAAPAAKPKASPKAKAAAGAENPSIPF